MRAVRSWIIVAVAAVVGLATFAGAGGAAFAESGALDKAAVEKVVHDYLIANPEVLVEAMTVLRERQQQAEAADRQVALKDHKAALYQDASTPVAGDPKGDVTVIEFFDYACPYCKQVALDLQKLLKADAHVRLLYKEYPVLGPNSLLAAKAALAARLQGKYVEFHNALMSTRGQFNEEVLMRVAGTVGLDTAKLKTDMATPAIEAALKGNRELADALTIHGTPAFIIGGSVYPGAMDLDALKQLVAAARKG
jgi:protein-disulfide isomerase